MIWKSLRMWSVQAIDLEFSRHLPKTNDRTTPQLKVCAQNCTKLRALQDGLTASMPMCWEGGFALLLAWAKLSRDFCPPLAMFQTTSQGKVTKLVQRNTTTRIQICGIRIEALSTHNEGTVMGGMGRRAFFWYPQPLLT